MKKCLSSPRVNDQNLDEPGLNEASLDKLEQAEQFKEAYNRALGLIARREHSAAELRRKLTSRGYSDDLCERVLEQLHNRGLQNDRTFAEEYIASKKRRGFGPMKITAELQQHAIDRDTVRGLLAERDDEWLERCREVMTRKYGTSVAVDQRELLRRSRFLQQRGFTASMVARVVRDTE